MPNEMAGGQNEGKTEEHRVDSTCTLKHAWATIITQGVGATSKVGLCVSSLGWPDIAASATAASSPASASPATPSATAASSHPVVGSA